MVAKKKAVPAKKAVAKGKFPFPPAKAGAMKMAPKFKKAC